jgi:biofilm protein TabA
MIFDDLQSANRYCAVHPGFAAGFALLRREDLREFPVGRHEVDGERLALIIGQDSGRTREGGILEAHERFIDIQFVVSGNEEMGWRRRSECQTLSQPYDRDRDIMFFADRPQSWFAVPPGKFAVFFPDDAHAPLAGTGLLYKAVVKVAINW